jgi:hypothetical protein
MAVARAGSRALVVMVSTVVRVVLLVGMAVSRVRVVTRRCRAPGRSAVVVRVAARAGSVMVARVVLALRVLVVAPVVRVVC